MHKCRELVVEDGGDKDVCAPKTGPLSTMSPSLRWVKNVGSRVGYHLLEVAGNIVDLDHQETCCQVYGLSLTRIVYSDKDSQG